MFNFFFLIYKSFLKSRNVGHEKEKEIFHYLALFSAKLFTVNRN